MEYPEGKFYSAVTYSIRDISDGLISKGMAVRHYEKLHPELHVISISSFKIIHETESISIRVLVQKKVLAGALPPGTIVDSVHVPQKLLNPGYDELQTKFDEAVRHESQCHAAYEELETAHLLRGEVYLALEKAYKELEAELDELKKRNLALAEMAGVDISPEAPDVQLCVKETVEIGEEGADLVVGTDTNVFNEAVAKGCDQADVIGPDDEGDDGND